MRFHIPALSLIFAHISVAAALEVGSKDWLLHNATTQFPDQSNDYCRIHCSTFNECTELFPQGFFDLRIKLDFTTSMRKPSKSLITADKFFGETIGSQTFETQFVIDVSYALSISPCRTYVNSVDLGINYLGGDENSVIVTFRLFESGFDAIQSLTKQLQVPTSDLCQGNLTRMVDPLFGLDAVKNDFSLKLMHAIDIVGGPSVKENQNGIKFLNQGSSRSCEEYTTKDTVYCEFEQLFLNDLAYALDINSTLIDVLFVKEFGLGSVLVYFRLLSTDFVWVELQTSTLKEQLCSLSSRLYQGNVTVRVDKTWGVSGKSGTPRVESRYHAYTTRDQSNIEPYERCKHARRCPRGSMLYNQSTAESLNFGQQFAGGKLINIQLFSDFEDWSKGTNGWGSRLADKNKNLTERYHIKGSHWSPFEFKSLGPIIPSFNATSNDGLVLNRNSLQEQLAKQEKRIEDVNTYVRWMKENAEIANLDAKNRFRRDVRKGIMATLKDYDRLLEAEKAKYSNLVVSGCTHTQCSIVFNTSNLKLTGAINATGNVAITSDGTEVALWSFNSIDIGPEVNISVIGQRAMALLSRSSVRINTTIKVEPNTLGGFPGGFSIANKAKNGYLDRCVERSKECPGDAPLSSLDKDTVSNNVNGPGSPSVRVYKFIITSDAPVRHEIQRITTSAQQGLKLSGGFIVHFGRYNSTFIPHDATEKQMKIALEDSLNAAKINILRSINRTNIFSGVGRIEVTRNSFGESGGYTWNLTFTTAIGNVAPLRVTSMLEALNSTIDLRTIVQGNSIGGSFILKFLGFQTRRLPYNVSAKEMETALVQDIPHLLTAQVVRSDPTNNCNDGFCSNGPSQSGGYKWTLTLTTAVGNVSPFSPTSQEFDLEGLNEKMISISHLTGCIQSDCPVLKVHNSDEVDFRSFCSFKKPFSLSFGSAGAGYGGTGGSSGSQQRGRQYGDSRILNLYGGSGGSLGYLDPCDALMSERSYIRGGDGGGAIEIAAVNDIILGHNSSLLCDGGPGSDGFMFAGGGGSGGSILLAAGGIVRIEGNLSARGGNGGKIISNSRDGGGGGGGRIAIYGQSISFAHSSKVNLVGGRCTSQGSAYNLTFCEGTVGTLHVEEAIQHEVFVDWSRGAEGTSQSLFVQSSKCYPEAIREGPLLDLGGSFQPERISFYLMLDKDLAINHAPSLWGAAVQLHESLPDYKVNINEEILIGIVVGRYQMKTLANFKVAPKKTTYLDFMKVFHNLPTQMNEWYKFDIRLNWTARTYDLHLNDILSVDGAYFYGNGIRGLSLNVLSENVKLWIDEVYLGNDFTMGFKCPKVTNNVLEMDRPIQHGWSKSDIGPTSNLHPMQRHESFLSRRKLYNRLDHGGLVPFDGIGHQKFRSDVEFRYETGDHRATKGRVSEGAILKVPPGHDFLSRRSKYFWYGEHTWVGTERREGGVFACSTYDFNVWTNEGAMLSYENISDFVYGLDGDFAIERPKVLYNNKTNNFVMWMTISNETHPTGMAGVAVSRFPSGPFDFIRSFYPDGNETKDQTVLQMADGSAYLIRTYYATVDYILPAAVMQPMWESVRNADGTMNFSLSYHRAYYDPGYDNIDDILEQRLNGEDREWKVVCVNRHTGIERNIPYGSNFLNKDGAMCDDLDEFKKVLGQAIPTAPGGRYDVIQSRYLNPEDPENNFWLPSSVPGVEAQTWKANAQDRRVADNPVHPTFPDQLLGPPTVVEKRRTKYIAISQLTEDYLDTTGVLHSLEGELATSNSNGSQAVDAEYLLALVGVSAADVNELVFGWEGIFPAESHLAWEASYSYHPPLYNSKFTSSADWDTLFHDYEIQYHDKAYYSPACVMDSDCQEKKQKLSGIQHE